MYEINRYLSVLKLEERNTLIQLLESGMTEEKLKDSIKKKLVFGITKQL